MRRLFRSLNAVKKGTTRKIGLLNTVFDTVFVVWFFLMQAGKKITSHFFCGAGVLKKVLVLCCNVIMCKEKKIRHKNCQNESTVRR